MGILTFLWCSSSCGLIPYWSLCVDRHSGFYFDPVTTSDNVFSWGQGLGVQTLARLPNTGSCKFLCQFRRSSDFVCSVSCILDTKISPKMQNDLWHASCRTQRSVWRTLSIPPVLQMWLWFPTTTRMELKKAVIITLIISYSNDYNLLLVSIVTEWKNIFAFFCHQSCAQKIFAGEV